MFFTHQVLQCVAHQFLLQSLHQSHLNRLSLVLRLAVGAEPLRQNRSVLTRRKHRLCNWNLIRFNKQVKKYYCDSRQCSSSHLCHRRVLAEVEVTTEIAVVADDFWQDVGVTGVTELGFLRKLSDVHEAQEVSFQLVHLVHYVGIQ